MAILSVPNIFSAGAVIIASQHNTNFTTIYADYSGNIDNTNIAAAAGIVYSKLTLTGSIVNADINASAAIVASKLDLTSPGAIGSTAAGTGAFSTLKVGTTHQGDVLYDNGTSIVRLTPGISGQFLKTQGASANPVWATVASLSNVLFSYSGSVDNVGYYASTSLTGAPTSNYSYWNVGSVSGLSYKTIISTKWVKIAGVSTVTVWAYIWTNNSNGNGQTNCKVNIGTANGNVSGTATQTTPEWKSFTIDVSGLSNGTTYDVTIQLGNANTDTSSANLGSIIALGS